MTYQLTDQLFLWLLTRPEQPILIGEINLLRATQGVSLRYSDDWRARGDIEPYAEQIDRLFLSDQRAEFRDRADAADHPSFWREQGQTENCVALRSRRTVESQ